MTSCSHVDDVSVRDALDMPRVLSVQSHVVSGCVGNRAAVFPLQLLGFDTDFINSVHFSNHTQYPTVKGKVLSGPDLQDIKEALAENGLLSHNYLLTGYIGSDGFLSNILDLLTAMECEQPSIKYICDPVLGDHGRCYVPAALIDIYRESVIPRAYMITPNQFEAELLSGHKISCEEDAVAAVLTLLQKGPKIVVLTSAEFSGADSCPPGKLFCYCAKRMEPFINDSGATSGEVSDSDLFQFVRVTVDRIDGYFTGTGDCTAALMLAWIHRTNEDIGLSLMNTMATMQGILTLTRQKQIQNGVVSGLEMTDKRAAEGKEGNASTRAHQLRCSELAVIAGKSYIEAPPVMELQLELRSWEINNRSGASRR